MLNHALKEKIVGRLLPQVQTPGQYLGGELNAVVKDHRQLRGKLCLAFPDAYAIGMSHYGLQVLYHLMNARADRAKALRVRFDQLWADLGSHGDPTLH